MSHLYSMFFPDYICGVILKVFLFNQIRYIDRIRKYTHYFYESLLRDVGRKSNIYVLSTIYRYPLAERDINGTSLTIQSSPSIVR